MMPVIYLADQRDGEMHFTSANPVRQIEVKNWSGDLSPWPMKAVFGKEDFRGNGDAFLNALLEEVNAVYGKQPLILAGYSLAGLFSLYACTKTDRFAGCISASGSLWYKGFTAYLKEHPVHCQYAVLSLGRKEKKSRNPILASVQDCTMEVKRIIEPYCQTAFLLQEGGHFADISARISEDVACLNQMAEY